MKLSDKAFDRIVKKTIRHIPPEVRRQLQNILITVQKRPQTALLKQMGMPVDQTLLGVYTGVSHLKRSITYPPLFPDTIILFQEPIESICDTIEQIEEQVRKTVIHEIAHALGLDEKQLQALGYG